MELMEELCCGMQCPPTWRTQKIKRGDFILFSAKPSENYVKTYNRAKHFSTRAPILFLTSMSVLPKFRLYGEADLIATELVHPSIALRSWNDLYAEQKMENNRWLKDYSREILHTIENLNHHFLRACPGKDLHVIVPFTDPRNYYGGNVFDKYKASLKDFCTIFREHDEAMVFRMLTVLA